MTHRLARMQELFDAGFYALEELARAIEDYAGSVDLDPERLEAVRQPSRSSLSLIKKYGPTLDDVIETGRKARAELDLVDSADSIIANLTVRERRQRAQASAAEASRSSPIMRVTGARKLAKAVDVLLPELGMTGGKFLSRADCRDAPTDEGRRGRRVPCRAERRARRRPLARVASGGELSRVMLALKTILARADSGADSGLR